MIPTRFLLPSATLPGPVLHSVLDTLTVTPGRTTTFRRSNDRPNVFLTVHKMQYAISSFKDLDFLIPENWNPEIQIHPFVIFFDSIEDSVKAAERMQERLPPEHRKRIMWINSDTTAALRETATQEFARGNLLGLYCTDSFGMVGLPASFILLHRGANAYLLDTRVLTSPAFGLLSSGGRLAISTPFGNVSAVQRGAPVLKVLLSSSWTGSTSMKPKQSLRRETRRGRGMPRKKLSSGSKGSASEPRARVRQRP